jgi:hypothetical protein
MDSRRRITLQLPQHHATKYRVTLLFSCPALPASPNEYDEPLGSYYYSMNRPDIFWCMHVEARTINLSTLNNR